VGVPSESHQFPAEAVVVAVVVWGIVVEDAVFVVEITDVVDVVEVVDVEVDVFVDVVQDERSIATISNKLKTNQMNLFFNFYPLFLVRNIFAIIVVIYNSYS
jgi:hypothetical protein